MYKSVIHTLSIRDDDPLFDKLGHYILSLAYKIEVTINHHAKTYLCYLDQGQYDMFTYWVEHFWDEELKAKVMEQIERLDWRKK